MQSQPLQPPRISQKTVTHQPSSLLCECVHGGLVFKESEANSSASLCSEVCFCPALVSSSKSLTSDLLEHTNKKNIFPFRISKVSLLLWSFLFSPVMVIIQAWNLDFSCLWNDLSSVVFKTNTTTTAAPAEFSNFQGGLMWGCDWKVPGMKVLDML